MLVRVGVVRVLISLTVFELEKVTNVKGNPTPFLFMYAYSLKVYALCSHNFSKNTIAFHSIHVNKFQRTKSRTGYFSAIPLSYDFI